MRWMQGDFATVALTKIADNAYVAVQQTKVTLRETPAAITEISMPAASVQLTGFIPDTADALSRRPGTPGLLARIVEALHAAQTRRAEREIARFIESRGGRMTDDLERKIERHFV